MNYPSFTMKVDGKLLFATLLFFVLIMIGMDKAEARDYYIDSAASGDSGQATLSDPWKTLTQVNATTFSAGDRIFFKSGGVWTGQLHPLGSGNSTASIIIDKYGGTAKPIINGGGLIGGTVYLYNQQYWEINNLEITNDSSTNDVRMGVHVVAENSGARKHFQLKNLTIHNVKGGSTNTAPYKNTGGIFFEAKGPTKAWFDDILIQDNNLYTIDRTGIFTSATYGNNADPNFTPLLNVVVRNNVLRDIGGDGILIRSTNDALIEYNTVSESRSRSTEANVAVWPINSNNTIMQFNEVYNTIGTIDGESFDCDYSNRGCTVQYNYSHDNDGGFLLMMGNTFNDNIVVRYNISQGDKTRTFQLNGGTAPLNTQIYNNTIFINPGDSVLFFGQAINASSNYLSFRNNVIANAGTLSYQGGNATFDANFYGGTAGVNEPTSTQDLNKLSGTVGLVCGGCGGLGMNSVDGYKLKTGSTALGSGVTITNNGGRDYWGNTLGSSINRGAYGGPAVNALSADSFNGGTVGTAPTGWTSTIAGATVESYPSTADKSVRFQDASTTDALDLNKSFADQTGKLVIQYQFLQTTTTGEFKLYLKDGTTNGISFFAKDGLFSYKNSSGAYPTVGTYAANEWYTVKVEADVATDLCTIYVNGTAVATNVGFGTALTKANGISFATGAAKTGTAYLNNVFVIN
ncbi:right-handed parallel beta-helix repeat-containing protein [Paenibacillus roseipurpureus]|uniref:Right-handed parallel beta-helix repeat-containing protein n=1 Tax=Paenibacillus roseopurpureus TaxID=2918901 RepID=A0AA96LRV1_9BACL|nr:right-handed parallel beta-helix repeat-containing protein [Paenibacillus sp. MBLB1832]WNR46077.1 right-handed parallel beta-helix repeat-containing protein [Paenibacillus sp. MBLB1832]